MNLLNKSKVVIVLISALLGIIFPLLLYFIGNGFVDSFSTYHLTEAKWYLFGFLMVMSLGFFLGQDRYKISGLLLVSIAFINIEYGMLHNILAILFFLYTSVLMLSDKRFYFLSLPIFFSAVTIPFQGLYMFEFIGLWCISVFNILYVLRFLRFFKSK